jgi:hypothetical protein
MSTNVPDFKYVTPDDAYSNYIFLHPGQIHKADAFTTIVEDDGWDYVYYLANRTPSPTLFTYSIEYVYIMTNESVPGQVKIGMTTLTPQQRAKQLSGTSVATPWNVAFYWKCFRSRLLEAELHDYFKAYRVSDNREMFHLDVETAKRAVKKLGKKYSFKNLKK